MLLALGQQVVAARNFLREAQAREKWPSEGQLEILGSGLPSFGHRILPGPLRVRPSGALAATSWSGWSEAGGQMPGWSKAGGSMPPRQVPEGAHLLALSARRKMLDLCFGG